MGVKRCGLHRTPTIEYGHKNICKGTTEWDLNDHGGTLSVRGFETLEDMNDSLVNSINKYVKEDDYLIHLGDWSFGGIENIWEFRKQIICKNIILILGNHDHHIANNKSLPNLNWYDSNYLGNDSEAIFESIHSYLELVISSPVTGKKTYNLMHFPLAVWNKSHHNRIMLHGHCHGSFQHPGRSLDVGVDKAFELFGEYKPFSQEDINNFMENRDFKQFSHHNPKTN